MVAKWTPPNPDKLVADYLAGISQNVLAKRNGVSRRAIYTALTDRGVTIRGTADANRLMMERRRPDEHRRNTKAAHDATRHRKPTFEEACRTAKTRERRQTNMSEAERLLASWMNERGVDTIAQKAIGPYNCDIAAGPVAVEVFGGSWHGHGRHAARMPRRARYILDRGWLLAIVWVDALRYPLQTAAADYLVSLVQAARRDPSLRGQYRVIWGDGEAVPASELSVDNLAAVPARGAALNRSA